MLWRRLDEPGHDFCRLYRLDDGWRLSGTAVFRERQACSLNYDVFAAADWTTRRATVQGHLGGTALSFRIQSSRSGRWKVDGVAQPQLDGCIDLDLAFTPATNLIAIRRLALKVGAAADAPAAYLAFPRIKFVVLPQTYRRVSAHEYDYASPTADYAGRLKVAKDGWVVDYPGIFEQVLI
jgi:hypothetical protein